MTSNSEKKLQYRNALHEVFLSNNDGEKDTMS